jgi:hypothetical protein
MGNSIFNEKDIAYIEQLRGVKDIKSSEAAYLKHLKRKVTKIDEGYMCFCTMNERRIYKKSFFEWYDLIK